MPDHPERRTDAIGRRSVGDIEADHRTEARIPNDVDRSMLGEARGDCGRTRLSGRKPHGEGSYPSQCEERLEGAGNRPGERSGGPKGLGVGPVSGRDDATEKVAVATDELRARLHHGVGTEVEWLLPEGSCERVVDDELCTLRVVRTADRLEITHDQHGIRRTFRPHEIGRGSGFHPSGRVVHGQRSDGPAAELLARRGDLAHAVVAIVGNDHRGPDAQLIKDRGHGRHARCVRNAVRPLESTDDEFQRLPCLSGFATAVDPLAPVFERRRGDDRVVQRITGPFGPTSGDQPGRRLKVVRIVAHRGEGSGQMRPPPARLTDVDSVVEINRSSGLRRLERFVPFPVGPSTFEDVWSRRTDETIAVIDADRAWTTRELRDEVDRVARALTAAGHADGSRLAWVLENDVGSLISLLATVRVGAVWIGLSDRATNAEREAVLDDAHPDAVFATLPDDAPGVTLPEPPAPTVPAAIAYTSGTTGRPKGAVHTQQQLLYPSAAAIATEGLDEDARIGTPLPLSTLNILLLGPLTALACGGVAVMMKRTSASGLAEDLEQYAVTRALLVPTMVHDLVSQGVTSAQLQALERLIVGGAGDDARRAAVAQDMLGVPLIASYGLSEAPTGVARMRVGDGGATPLPGVDIRIEDDGEITLSSVDEGPWAGCWQGTLGYWGNPEATAALWRGGRLHTGDAGTFGPDTGLLVSGRMSEMINRGGANIAPAEVEAALLALDGVADAAVFGVPDDRLGHIVAAAVVGDAAVETLGPALRSTLSGYKVPAAWLRLDTLPRNPNGKVDRSALRAMVGN